MWQIPIYSAEIEAGLTDKILGSNSLSYISKAELCDGKDFKKLDLAKSVSEKYAKATNQNQFDLEYLKTILVSTGWNRNDDVFDRAETWAARNTPEDKPFNYQHDAVDIIGHITDNFVVDESGNAVSETLPVDQLPPRFHIVTGAVLYKMLDNADYKKRMEVILAEIKEDKWFVSMEVLFKGFDYALINTKTAEATLLPRNEKTAFLTKHLRAYGGTGIYQDQKLGRVLRSLCFSGKGLVRNPGNPDSIIINDVSKSNLMDFNQSEKLLGYLNLKEKINVTEQELKAEVERLTAALKENDIKEWKAKVEQSEAKLSKADELLKASQIKATELDKSLAEANTKLQDSVKKIEELEKEKVEIVKELSTVHADVKKNKRIAEVKEKLKLDNDASVKYVEASLSATDEQFALQLSVLPVKAEAVVPVVKTPTADAKVLDTATQKVDAALATAVVTADESANKVREQIASYYSK